LGLQEIVNISENKLIRSTNETHRCRGPGRDGESQCVYASIKYLRSLDPLDPNYYDHGFDSENCPRHAGRPPADTRHAFHFQSFQESIDRFHTDPNLLSLRPEIAATRTMFEQTWNSCRTSLQLTINTPRLEALIGRIESLVKTLNLIEHRNARIFTFDQASALMDAIATTVMSHVDDPKVIQAIQTTFQDHLTLLEE